ncbi:coproporphyrinogen III oxidase [Pseudomonas sp. MMS21-TM103]|uniref:coproporphyrinogen III oxidase n=1 Tax=unclassified Pseudomonas TaxID=196821 RepID=UPI001EDFF179|nr:MULTISPECIES: coproporphyrinogen III oxidase [unclassified Pseudomonas]MCG4453087.1 coproporphyrinogen III oxidase [Pseudomonas sp. MMS21 TM103]
MRESNSWDSKLLGRYAHGDASHSCYPETSAFHRGIGSLDLLRALRGSRLARRALSLAVQLPINQQRASGSPSDFAAYLERLEREIDTIGCHLGAQQRVEQFHLAGGSTPSAAQLLRLMTHLRKRFNFLDYDTGDYSIEIQLADSDWPTMGRLRELGFNHVSIGVPDLAAGSDATLAWQDPRHIRSLIDAARALNYRSVNIDIGYGRAWQTRASFARKVAAIVELQPNRVTVFDYADPPQRYRPLGRLAARGLSDREDKLAMQRQGVEQLSLAGYRYVGMGLFALADDDLVIAQENASLQRNCQGFSRHPDCDHVGLGVAAISQIDGLYVQNTSNLQGYQAQLDRGQLASCRGFRCGPDDRLRGELIERLICDFGLDIRGIEARFGLVFREYFADAWPALEQMQRDGLIMLDAASIAILPAGRLLVYSVCRLFDRYSGAPRVQSVSRAV